MSVANIRKGCGLDGDNSFECFQAVFQNIWNSSESIYGTSYDDLKIILNLARVEYEGAIKIIVSTIRRFINNDLKKILRSF